MQDINTRLSVLTRSYRPKSTNNISIMTMPLILKNIKDVEMACQKVHKVGMIQKSKGQCIGKAPFLFTFFTLASLRAAAESAPIHAVIDAMHK